MPDTDTMLAKVEVAESDLATVDDMLGALDFVALLKEAVKEAELRVKARMLAHVIEHGPIINGTVRYYAATDKTTKCINAQDAIHAIMEVTSGEEQRLLDCLSANWIKPGATRKLFEEFGQPGRFEVLFETKEKTVLKDGEIKPAPKTLQSIDSRFLK